MPIQSTLWWYLIPFLHCLSDNRSSTLHQFKWVNLIIICGACKPPIPSNPQPSPMLFQIPPTQHPREIIPEVQRGCLPAINNTQTTSRPSQDLKYSQISVAYHVCDEAPHSPVKKLVPIESQQERQGIVRADREKSHTHPFGLFSQFTPRRNRQL